MLRVIAGVHRGRKLLSPKTEITRPTMDRVKEAIFSSIQFKIPGSIVLDLFSGSGAIAIEAISRGAMKAIAVEQDKKAFEIINKNKTTIGLNNLEVKKAEVVQFVNSIKGTKFDFIFMDPPYAETQLYNKTLKGISKSKLLNETGLLILEVDNIKGIEIPEGFVIQKNKKYGKSTILVIANNI